MVRVGKARSRAVFVAVCVCLALPAAAFAVTGTFHATTSQGNACGATNAAPCAVNIKIVNDVVYESSSRILSRANCKNGLALRSTTPFGSKGKLKNGHFHASNTFKVGLQKPFSAVETATLDFTVDDSDAEGTFKLNATIFKGKKVATHCNTGLVTFYALR